jgi:hypothetical protein
MYSLLKSLLYTGENTNNMGHYWQLLLRFTWQLPQTVLGFLIACAVFLAIKKSKLYHVNGASLLITPGSWGGISLAPFILADSSMQPNSQNAFFRHEYGHILQSCAFGPIYLLIIGLPSLISASVKNGRWVHRNFLIEKNADKRAAQHFAA